MIQEATGEVRSAPVDAEGQFAISVRCEGKYLATFMDDQRTKGVWRLSIGVMDKALVLPVAKMTNVSSEVIPSSR